MVIESLGTGLAALREAGVSLPPGAETTLAAYLELLARWNRTYNLTAVREPERMVGQHILDSLAVLPHVPMGRGAALLDVGSGGGLPGIPLAVARPEAAVTLLDANSKKAAFLEQARIELGLRNVAVVCTRVEAFVPDHRFDVVISRAFAELADIVDLARPVLAPGGLIVAMKGVVPHEELAQLPEAVQIEVVPIQVPGLAADRCLVRMSVAESTK